MSDTEVFAKTKSHCENPIGKYAESINPPEEGEPSKLYEVGIRHYVNRKGRVETEYYLITL